MAKLTPMRIARPTAHPIETARFYENGLGGQRLYEFDDHAGFSGVMIGLPGTGAHLELVHGRAMHHVPAPTPEDAIVLYYSSEAEFQHRASAMRAAGYTETLTENPYWHQNAKAFRDPDGYVLILAREAVHLVADTNEVRP